MPKDFLSFLVGSIVDYPEMVQITEHHDDMGILYTVDVHKDDVGKVVGRLGNTIKAIRTLLRVVGMKHGARVSLKINEPVGGKKYVEV